MELAALVSQTLDAAGITATLSGGGAVSMYTDNEYESKDLDFVTAEQRDRLSAALEPLGFTLASDGRHFTHPDTDLFLEFPADPLQFGDRLVQHDDIPRLGTLWGPLRVVTPTLCVMDRLAAYWHWNDRQAWDQAVMVASHREVDYQELVAYAKDEGADPHDIDKLPHRVTDNLGRELVSVVDDATTAITLIDAIDGDIASVMADATYDLMAFYDSIGARGANVVVPPTKTATVSRRRPRSSDRGRTIKKVKEIGRRWWKKESGYHRQACIENAFFRYTSIIGNGLRPALQEGKWPRYSSPATS